MDQKLTYSQRRELVFWRKKWRRGDFFTKDPELAKKIAANFRAALGEEK